MKLAWAKARGRPQCDERYAYNAQPVPTCSTPGGLQISRLQQRHQGLRAKGLHRVNVPCLALADTDSTPVRVSWTLPDIGTAGKGFVELLKAEIPERSTAQLQRLGPDLADALVTQSVAQLCVRVH